VLVGEVKGELIPEKAQKVRSPEPAPGSNKVLGVETIVSGSFFRSREEHQRNPVRAGPT